MIERTTKGGPGRHAPAFFFPACLGLLIAAAVPAAAQTPPPAAAATQPVPSALELSKMVWSTMLAIDHANRSGNYSVLRDLGSPGFQANNDAARLATIFADIRGQGIDLSNTILLAPTYSAAPAIIAPGVLRTQGSFGLRPTAISFDLYYQWDAGRWKLFGVSIMPVELARTQPAPRR
ncbi:MAG: hypothetical protein Q7J32_13075 [Sphingomonadaceae bacterium]|nr:hypothetical protein [Sphingomonadaceae bacterium]